MHTVAVLARGVLAVAVLPIVLFMLAILTMAVLLTTAILSMAILIWLYSLWLTHFGYKGVVEGRTSGIKKAAALFYLRCLLRRLLRIVTAHLRTSATVMRGIGAA